MKSQSVTSKGVINDSNMRTSSSNREYIMNELPQSSDAEQAVLGSVLKDNTILDRIITTLDNEKYFFHDKHKHIFRAILNLYEDSKPFDITMVAEEITRLGKIENISRSYLIDLIGGIGSTEY